MDKIIPDGKLCDYGCGLPAVTYFRTAEKYSCNKNPHKCPVYKLKRTSEKAKARMKYKQELLDKINRGELRCIYCGGVAKGLIELKLLPICQPKNQQSCPSYKKMAGSKISKSLKQAYQENPEMIERQKQIGFEVHSRPAVVLKKRKAMKELHKDPEFVNHYRNGIKKYFDSRNVEMYNKLHAAAKELFSRGVCEICGITEEACKEKNKKGLHMHCVGPDLHLMTKENWQTLCGPCHIKLHHVLRKQLKDA